MEHSHVPNVEGKVAVKILVTGAAGFIGYHLAKRLAMQEDTIVGIDNCNDYYDISLKYGRLADLGISTGTEAEKNNCTIIPSTSLSNFSFIFMDVTRKDDVNFLLRQGSFDIIIHLAAQAGVRYSLTNPDTYISNNVQGFLNILEAVRLYPVRHFIYASSSSVYGINTVQPFSENTAADHPASLYAATKRCNELMAHSYSHLYGIPTTGLRFFTVYGPWGRPDMALFLFTRAILEKRPIDVFNNGEMKRDFTYIDDIIEGIVRIIDHIPSGQKNWDSMNNGLDTAPARIYNIGNGIPVNLLDFIKALENELHAKAQLNMLPLQPGDIPVTWADCSNLEKIAGYHPKTMIPEGIKHFVSWYRDYYNINL
jgi:UDP-glucuronate 4-epimerase